MSKLNLALSTQGQPNNDPWRTHWARALNNAIRLVEASHAYERELSNFNTIENGPHGKIECYPSQHFRNNRQDVSSSVYGALKEAMVAAAQIAFGNQVTRFNINLNEFDALLPSSIECFDPIALWAAFETRFSGDGGANAANRALAEKLISALSLRNYETKVSGGMMVFETWNCIDSSFSDCRVAHASHERLNDTIRLLIEFAKVSENVALLRAIHAVQQNAWHYPLKFRSRDHLAPPNTIFNVVLYQKKVEYRFSLDVAEQINIFVSTHAQAMFTKA